MSSNDAKNEMSIDVLIDLAGICKKLAHNPVVPEDIRKQANKYAQDFVVLEASRGEGTRAEHFWGENLTNSIAQLLPRVLSDEFFGQLKRAYIQRFGEFFLLL